jgi:succinoglycan biosynthesis protein ExoL
MFVGQAEVFGRAGASFRAKQGTERLSRIVRYRCTFVSECRKYSHQLKDSLIVKLAYFAHDLNDPAIPRRVTMLREGGAQVTLFGFHRSLKPPADSAGPIDFGRTYDGRPINRIPAIARTAMMLGRWRTEMIGADIVMARTLEMLFLASIARMRFAPSASVVYECLDIHRMMMGSNRLGSALRAIEGRLLKGSDTLVVSSPAFVSEYFAKRYPHLPSICLVENKLIFSEIGNVRDVIAQSPAPGPPWRIGWFGVIRCHRSLKLLAALCRSAPGLVEVEIRGRPTEALQQELDKTLPHTPAMSFLGPYSRSDLGQLYGGIHFIWAMDFYEAESNSIWLLPNRLYEGSLYGAVPIALSSTATAQWLREHSAGILLAEPLDASLAEFVHSHTGSDYASERAKVARIPHSALISDAAECKNLVHQLARKRKRPGDDYDKSPDDGASVKMAKELKEAAQDAGSKDTATRSRVN